LPPSVVFSQVPPAAAAVFHILLGVTQGELERQRPLQGPWDDAERLYNVYSNNSAVGADLSTLGLHADSDPISRRGMQRHN